MSDQQERRNMSTGTEGFEHHMHKFVSPCDYDHERLRCQFCGEYRDHFVHSNSASKQSLGDTDD